MKRSPLHLLVIGLTLLFLSGCTRLALHAASSLVPDLTGVFFEECDLELARQSLPAQLKLMEGLLKKAPKNKEFLTALCMGYTGYAMLFVEEEDPERASGLYQRARMYGLRAIGIEEPMHQAVQDRLKKIDAEHIEPLFWIAMSWNGWINLNLDKPAALGELSTAQACLDRVMEIDPGYFFGTPYLISGSMLAARPGILGGDAAMAKDYFSRAMAASNGAFFLAPYYYAKYYAVRVQDKALFLDLIRRVEQGRPDQLKEVCLINAAVQQKIKGLKETTDERFF
ncbi:MAG: TRAP transporter TatT component family protein [Candidatus Desulfacyla sp.]